MGSKFLIERFVGLAALVGSAAMAALDAGAEARYVFYFIGDGMGNGHVNAAQAYLREAHGVQEPLLMSSFPVVSQARTHSANRPITDSAAAGTALSTGSKTVNSRIGMAPDSTELRSIARDFMEAGYAVGVGTSVAGDDATPAAFYAHALSRGDIADIAACSPSSGLDFLAGGGFKVMHKEKEGKEWLAEMERRGYRRVSSLPQLEADSDGRRFLMIPDYSTYDQVGYTLDSVPQRLLLSDITRGCLETLRRNNEDRFFMMIEGGNIDWAAHANDAATVVKEIVAFQDAIRVAYDFYLEHPDETLIVVTADHDTGGMALGRTDKSFPPRLSLLDNQRMSKDSFNNWCRSLADADGNVDMEWPRMQDKLREAFGLWEEVELSEPQEKRLRKAFDDTFVNRTATDTETLYQTFGEFTVTLFDILNEMYGVGWTTSYHTGNPVPVFAVGEGSEAFSRYLDNTEIPMLILQAAGLGRK